ncbi:hypothetical protein ANO11243_071530 [Dothideomycetidae sp. 11243]|nr:hypothetical protein ANO11243_071530 [fungal sp. No.11243]
MVRRPNVPVNEFTQIPLADGTLLSVRTWMPEHAHSRPVPAILEYLPYPKGDMTAKRDALNHPYVASRGYACVRVDMRGSGDSEGLLLGEYLKQEQDDALEVLAWIATQPWCTGSVGMIGISWGGFNGLQVAARRPPQLKAVISLCSTDDRYGGDIHYMGGCMLIENLTWGASMFAIEPAPPDETFVGDKWRQIWLDRLESGGNYVVDWVKRQRRDEFWNHAAICEDYSAIQCPVYLVGGWADPYHESIFRMLENLQCPTKALVGPWGHSYPNFAEPHPQIGFLQESVRWWDKWLKGIDSDIMKEPKLRCYMQDTVPPRTHYDSRPGHWIAETAWPSSTVRYRSMHPAAGKLLEQPSTSTKHLTICSPQTVGVAAGKWLNFGTGPEGPSDQRRDAAESLIFDTDVFVKATDLLGAPVVRLKVASDKPNAILAATLSEVLPDGSSTRLTYGVLNLTHRESDREPSHLEPGRFYNITLKMGSCCQRVSSGSRLRLALSTAYFPVVWPSPEITTLTVDCSQSRVDIPHRSISPNDADLKPFPPAVNGPPLRTKVVREGKQTRTVETDKDFGDVTVRYDSDEGAFMINETGWCYGVHETVTCTIHPDDPLSAKVEQRFIKEYGHARLNLVIEGWLKMTADKTHFFITGRLDASESGARVFGRDYSWKILRDHV